MISRTTILRFDLVMPALAVAISLLGVALIAGATHNSSLEGLWLKQLLVLGIGVVAMVLVGLVDYRLLLRFAFPIYLVVVGLLLFLLVFGRAAGGARSWLSFGAFHFQPSEFAKLAIILVLARAFARMEKSSIGLADIGGPLALAGVPILLTAAQPDLGTAMTMAPLLLGVAVVSGLRLRAVVALLLIGLLLFSFGWMFVLKDYQKERLRSFINPDDDPSRSGYQIRQSLIAIGSGGLWGKGPFLGSQSQLNFVPAQHTDFIFSVLGEEWGFACVALALLLYAALLTRALLPIRKVYDVAGMLVVVGVVCYIAFQTAIIALMSIGLLPTTGVPMPFLSYGGSSLLTCMLCVGLVVSVYAHRGRSAG